MKNVDWDHIAFLVCLTVIIVVGMLTGYFHG